MHYRGIGGLLVLLFPVLVTIGISLIPLVPDYSNHEMGARAVAETGRWLASHLLAAVAFGVSILSVNAVIDHLREHSHEIPGFIAPIMAIGAGLYGAGMGADGIGPIAVRSAGADPTLFFDGSGWMVSGTFTAATACFGVGLISLACHANHHQMMQGVWRYVIFISALLLVSFPAIPSGWALYGEAVAAWGVFGPLGLAIWRSD